ncbi:MAG: PQQ-dependent sugar dehydrogenase, partial [Nitrosopumilus sp. (ex Thoosa mismalolli)]|nr:PQQ-dependent sugar dehydrogenase [Nitrosopumilus sp. (ex Thoosa mismalolli)]
MKELLILLLIFTTIPFAFAEEFSDLGVKVQTVADNLTIPWSIDWLPNGDMIFTERNGNLRIIQNGELQDIPLLSLSVAGVEGGMLGVSVDPKYSENNFIYLYYTYNEFLSTQNKLVRYHHSEGILTEDRVLLDGIPGGPFHDGGRIQFGPDGKLYITTGDAGDPNLSQDLNSLAGKILRINSDGTIPEDNPWDDSPIYSIGHRNPQGIDWDDDGNLVATEHGPSGWRGNAHDELNLIIPGSNYGWPDVIGDEVLEGAVNPILHTGDDTWAPSGGEFYEEDKIPQWTGKYFVATLRGSHLHMIDFDLENNKVVSHEKLFQDDFGRLRDVQTGPDGYLYILTSNQDGRGFPNVGDDKILRVVPTSTTVDSFEDCATAGNPIMKSYPRQCNSDGINFVEEVDTCEGISFFNPINAKAKIENWDSGVMIRVEGCVDNSDLSKGVDVTIMDPSGNPVGSRNMTPQVGGSFTVFFEDQLNKQGEYSVIIESRGSTETISFVLEQGTNIENTNVELQVKDGYWQNYFEHGETVFGEAYFFDGTIVPEKVNIGTVDIRMTKPSGETEIIAKEIPITDNYVKFEISITDDFERGKYLLRPIYTVNELARIGDHQGIFYVGKEQNFTYSGEGGPLDVKAQFIEYDLSPIRFDKEQKSISFDFEKLDGTFAGDGHLQFDSDIGLQIQRPLISPPYTIIIETDEDVIEYDPGYRVDIRENGYYEYKLALDEEMQKGTVTIIGTYVIPEFGSIVVMIMIASIGAI